MPKLKDEPCSLPGITPRQHHARRAGGLTGQKLYPFRAMIMGDFFILLTNDAAIKARNAANTFCRKQNGRKFTVRPAHDGWVCRRVQ